MPVVQQGSINTTALIVPDVYVQIVPPQVTLLNGVPTNVLGVVGTASWGPVNAPTIFGDMAGYAQQFGPLVNRQYDMGTAVAAAVLQGANNFTGVRVSDGSDVAAQTVITISSTVQLTLTSKYTGSLANADTVTILPGTAGGTSKITIARAGLVPEVFDNITGTGNAFWVNAANAINNGQNSLRGASQLVIATAGVGTASASAVTNPYTLSGGTDGASLGTTVGAAIIAGGGSAYAVNDTITLAGGSFTTAAVLKVTAVSSGAITAVSVLTAGLYITLPTNPATQGSTSGSGSGATFTIPQASAVLLGVDTTPRSGMYALRNTGASVAMLVDCDDPTAFSAQVAFGLAEGIYLIGTTPPGDTIPGAIAAKATAGIDSYAFKYLFGDWVLFNDTVNGVIRAISPQGFVAGLLVNLSPEQSSLNKPLNGIVGTQSSAANQVYSSAELQQLIQAGIDVICNPAPGGNYFACRAGHNSSSNPLINGDNYTRMTNYIAFTLSQGMGQFVGQLQTTTERAIAKSTLDYFLANLEDQNMIGDPNGGPAFSVQLDAGNNPDSRVALGYQQADVKVKYLSVVEKFIVNVEGGTSVSISKAA